MKPRTLGIEEIAIGDQVSFTRQFTDADVSSFAELSRDHNPLHTDDSYAKETMFGRRIVHGMLLGAACSELVGMYLPGLRALYVSQELIFKKPVYPGDTLAIKGEVLAKSASTGIVEIAITFLRGDELVLEGRARVKVL
jgi:acyl dehydratase